MLAFEDKEIQVFVSTASNFKNWIYPKIIERSWKIYLKVVTLIHGIVGIELQKPNLKFLI